MEVKALTGTGIGLFSVPTDRRVSNARHNLNKVTYAVAREGFKKMVEYNVWGLGTALLTAWWKDKALMKKWQDVWFNLGAENKDWWVLYNKAEKGYNRKKAILLKLAPAKIKSMYQKATKTKISGQRVLGEDGGLGAVDWAVIFANVAVLFGAISGILGATMDKSGGELADAGMEETDAQTEAEILAAIKKAEDEAKKNENNNNNNGNGGDSLSLGIALPMILLVGGALFLGNKK